MRTARVIAMVAVSVVLLPLMPLVLAGWGFLRLRSGQPRTRPLVAIALAGLSAALLWPGLFTGRGSSPALQAHPVATASEPAATDDPASAAGSEANAAPMRTPASVPTTAAAQTPAASRGSGTTAPTSTHARTATKSSTAATALVPVAGVVDGDTLRVRIGGVTERVRVIGIDTPELAGRECYAQQAASRMQSLVQSRSVRLARDDTQADRDRYGRLLRHVSLPDGRLVAEILIEAGMGREYTFAAPHRHQAAYRQAQARARLAGRGIWGAGCATETPPRTLSGTSPPSGSPGAPNPGPVQPLAECRIKGNINRQGERIYHVPGGRSYDDTKISESKGERWFCSEAQAVAAGWRRARN